MTVAMSKRFWMIQRSNVDKEIFAGKWNQIRGKSKDWWSLINDIDLGRLDKSPDKLKKYVMLLQVKYGYTRKFAGEEINRRVAAHEAEENQAPAMKTGKPGVQTQNSRVVKTLKKESTK